MDAEVPALGLTRPAHERVPPPGAESGWPMD